MKDILINKNNPIKDYHINLVKIPNNYSTKTIYLDVEACLYFNKMCKDAQEKGFIIKAVSGYRTSEYQKELYINYVLKHGVLYASTCSAVPNTSEHESGLAVDVEGENKEYNDFILSKSYEWLKDNAHHYGFVLRYPKGKENITGYKFEPWHYRYVGSIATYLYQNDLTLEEYKKIDN